MTILCCGCGIHIEPNLKNMCDRCVLNQANLTAKIKTNSYLETCRGCEKYFVPPKGFKEFAWGSHDLLIFCLSKNRSIKKLNVKDSNFVYTEEHSERIIIEVKIEDEGVLQTVFLKYKIVNKQCGDCMRAESKQFWNSVVQVRQHPSSPRTFLYLEQMIKMHKAHLHTSNIKDRKDGIDFYFTNKNNAIKFTKFIENFYGCKMKESGRLISEDRKNNTTNMKSTFSCQLLPFCKDDLVAHKNQLYFVNKVSSSVEFIEMTTGNIKIVTNKQYFGNEQAFKKLLCTKDATEYDVLFINKNRNGYFDVTVTDSMDRVYETKTAIEFKENDKVLGYHVEGKTFLDDYAESMGEIILFRKYNNFDKEYKLKVDKPLDREMRLFLNDIDKEMYKEVAEEEMGELSKKFINAMQ